MATLSLPPPRKTTAAPTAVAAVASSEEQQHGAENEQRDGAATATTAVAKKQQQRTAAPSYEERCRAAAAVSRMTPEQRKARGAKLFVPRSLRDFDDGGAFPEIHVAQYPRHMGNPHLKKNNKTTTTQGGGQGGEEEQRGGGGGGTSSRAIVNVEIDKDGQVSYDAIVKRGTNSDKIVYSRHEHLRGGPADPEDIRLPTEEEERAEAERTQAALQSLLASKTALDKPSGSAIEQAKTSQNVEQKTQFIKYTPNPDAPGYNPAAAQRVIQMVPAQVDPMMPPKHKHVKAPRGPAEDFVPVLHAPPAKLTKEERDAWNIPACISNWKNVRGYTIPLDKRLAADGRGLREHTINPNFGTLSESLYVAERQARQEVRMRATVQKKLAMQEKEKREEDLRALAQQARMERGGGGGGTTGVAAPAAAAAGHSGHAGVSDDEDDDDSLDGRSGRQQQQHRRRVEDEDDDDDYKEKETEDDVAARQRERLRVERKRERERELRMEQNASLQQKKRRLEEERDVSEKIALGVHTGTGTGGLGGDVDARLYNQSGGMDSGFGADDEYNTYTKPLFDRQGGASSSSIYRPTRGETEYNADEQYDKLVQGATSKFKPDKGFAGAEGGVDVRGGAGASRTAPVQFEKSRES